MRNCCVVLSVVAVLRHVPVHCPTEEHQRELFPKKQILGCKPSPCGDGEPDAPLEIGGEAHDGAAGGRRWMTSRYNEALHSTWDS